MLNYLTGSTRSDEVFVADQFAWFSEYPKTLHELAVRYIEKYLLGSKAHHVIFKPDQGKDLEYYVDTDFSGGWQNTNKENPENMVLNLGTQFSMLVV